MTAAETAGSRRARDLSAGEKPNKCKKAGHGTIRDRPEFCPAVLGLGAKGARCAARQTENLADNTVGAQNVRPPDLHRVCGRFMNRPYGGVDAGPRATVGRPYGAGQTSARDGGRGKRPYGVGRTWARDDASARDRGRFVKRPYGAGRYVGANRGRGHKPLPCGIRTARRKKGEWIIRPAAGARSANRLPIPCSRSRRTPFFI